MKFKALRISDWKQFQNIDFHERLTILTVWKNNFITFKMQ